MHVQEWNTLLGWTKYDINIITMEDDGLILDLNPLLRWGEAEEEEVGWLLILDIWLKLGAMFPQWLLHCKSDHCSHYCHGRMRRDKWMNLWIETWFDS